MIYLTGDTHGNLTRLTSDYWELGKTLNKDDYLIILGDFGVIWSADSKYWLKWLEAKPWTTLFLDGNHENFDLLDKLETVDKFGGTCGRVSDSIYHLRRGQVYTIEGKTFFTLGGAKSIDKAYREEGISWWSQESPSEEEIDAAHEMLDIYDYKVDYVLTHTCPKQVKNDLLQLYGWENLYSDPLEHELTVIDWHLDYKHWFFGHFHKDVTIGNFSCLFENIVSLER